MRRAGPPGLFAALALALAVTPGWGGSELQLATQSALTPRQLAGLRVATGFEGRKPPAELKRLISRGEIGGVILFSDNLGGRKAIRRLTSALQRITRPAAVDGPLPVMVDQEGGLVRRLPGPPKPSAAEVGARGAGYARKLGKATARSMRSLGVNVNLAPVLDIGRPGGYIDQTDRAYSSKPGKVARVGGAFGAGLRAGGVADAGKHFPGLGSGGNTDDGVERIGLSRAKLRRADELPYETFAQHARMVMISNAVYTAFSSSPAVLTKSIVTGELRRRLGFAGVTISDALGAPAVTPFGGTGKVARRAARAGLDILLYSDQGEAARASRALRRAIAAGALSRSSAQTSADRILALGRSL
jgi:beta-N-acetylhexosaminidase